MLADLLSEILYMKPIYAIGIIYLYNRSLYFCGDIPVCFLKKVPKLDGLGKWKSLAISAMVLFVLSSSDIALRVIALNTSSWTVYPHIDFDSSDKYFGERYSLSA